MQLRLCAVTRFHHVAAFAAALTETAGIVMIRLLPSRN